MRRGFAWVVVLMSWCCDDHVGVRGYRRGMLGDSMMTLLWENFGWPSSLSLVSLDVLFFFRRGVWVIHAISVVTL